jgi:hypothetical protein
MLLDENATQPAKEFDNDNDIDIFMVRYAFHKVRNTNLQQRAPHPRVHGTSFQTFASWLGV